MLEEGLLEGMLEDVFEGVRGCINRRITKCVI